MAFLLLLKFVSWERASYSDSAAREKGNPEPLTHFSNSTSHSQCLGFGFSAHESALWRGMPCFNKNLTLYFPVCCSAVADILWEIRSRQRLLFGYIQAAILGAHSFTMTNTVEKLGVFLASRPPCAICIEMKKSVTTCALTFFERSEKNGRRNPTRFRVLGYKINMK